MKTSHLLAFACCAIAAPLLLAACDGESDSTVDDEVLGGEPSSEISLYQGPCESPWDWDVDYCTADSTYGCARFDGREVCYPPSCTANWQCPYEMTCVMTNPPLEPGNCQPKCGSMYDCLSWQTCKIRGFTSWKTCGW